MKNPSGHSITSELKKRVPVIISLLLLAGMIWLNVAVPEPTPEPDSVHSFVNTRISWEQSFHAGAWSGAE